MENNEVKNENATEEKKTESDKAEKEFNGTKWRCITIALTAILIFAATLFFVVTYFKDDSGRSLIEYIEQGLVVVAALISGCVSIISMINGKENGIEQQAHEEKLIEQQQEFEEKWNQKKIDADLKANARIEWIQKVREATSSFYSSCNDLLKASSLAKENDDIDEKYIRELLLNARQTGAILILYFGPETDAKIKRELDATDSNEGKNDKIVELVEEILKTNEALKNDRMKTKGELEVLDDKKRNLFEDIPIIKEEIIHPEEGYPDYQDILDEESDEYKAWAEVDNKRYEILSNYHERTYKRGENLKKLIDSIRLYLKIEWDRAKDNKD